MILEERNPTDIVQSAEKLRQLIIDNPTLPLVVFAGEDANCNGDYQYSSCSYINAYVGEFLDCMQLVNDEKCYCDRDDFEEDLAYSLSEDFLEEPDEEFQRRVKEVMAEYDPYWKQCIILYVNN